MCSIHPLLHSLARMRSPLPQVPGASVMIASQELVISVILELCAEWFNYEMLARMLEYHILGTIFASGSMYDVNLREPFTTAQPR